MNRKERRTLRKDKDLIKELYSIIVKYLPKLLDKFENLTDIRNKSYVTYKMKTPNLTVFNKKYYLDIEKSSFFIILYLRMSS